MGDDSARATSAPSRDGERGEITRLLSEWGAGDGSALDRLTPLVYDTLRGLARRAMQGERASHTLQATGLVHEAFEKLVDVDVGWNDRAHFYRLAARMMRRVLVDHARARRRDKRGSGREHVSLRDDDAAAATVPVTDLIALDDALHRLAELDARKSSAVELHYFGGLTNAELAAALGVSLATAERDLRFAKAWLLTEMKTGDG